MNVKFLLLKPFKLRTYIGCVNTHTRRSATDRLTMKKFTPVCRRGFFHTARQVTTFPIMPRTLKRMFKRESIMTTGVPFCPSLDVRSAVIFKTRSNTGYRCLLLIIVYIMKQNKARPPHFASAF
jgi:ribosomal protein L33